MTVEYLQYTCKTSRQGFTHSRREKSIAKPPHPPCVLHTPAVTYIEAVSAA